MGFLLILQLIKLERKAEKKREIFLDAMKVFSNTQEENKKIKLTMGYTMKEDEHRQLE